MVALSNDDAYIKLVIDWSSDVNISQLRLISDSVENVFRLKHADVKTSFE